MNEVMAVTQLPLGKGKAAKKSMPLFRPNKRLYPLYLNYTENFHGKSLVYTFYRDGFLGLKTLLLQLKPSRYEGMLKLHH